MSKYAVVKIGGSQFKVAVGDELVVEKIDGEKNKIIEFDNVLLLVDKRKITIGQPLIEGAKVRAKILDQVKGEKIRVSIYKAKSRYRRTKGYRKPQTKLQIIEISH